MTALPPAYAQIEMAVWPVIVQDWQQECCGKPFQVGDQVEWTLVLVDGDQSRLPEELLVEFRPEVERAAGAASDDETVVVERDGVTACRDAAAALGEYPTIRGVFLEEHHGGVPDDMPATRGTVRRIRLLTQQYRKVGEREWAPIHGAVELRDLDRSPDGFFADLESDGETRQVEDGLLVDLEVAAPNG